MGFFGASCGRCVVESVLDQVSIPERCGLGTQMFAENDYADYPWDFHPGKYGSIVGSSVPTCFVPFFNYAKQLRALNPNACFLLNNREWHSHLRSMQRWADAQLQFLRACQIVPATEEGLFNWIQRGYRSIREALNGTCFLELDVTQANRSDTVRRLARFMSQDVAKTDACWDATNVNM
jgi:hypothetical protein